MWILSITLNKEFYLLVNQTGIVHLYFPDGIIIVCQSGDKVHHKNIDKSLNILDLVSKIFT